MYHCYIDFYCIGHQRSIFETLQKMPPLEPFTHTFTLTGELEQNAAAAADVILADLRTPDPEQTLQILTACKKSSAQLILLADKGHIPALAGGLSQVNDLWTTPMTDAELRFRFLRWQQAYKADMDHWETKNFLNTTINSSPSLVWYKNRAGIHVKVNDSFCKAVGKTKEQVEGRGHAYIWNVNKEDPVCIASDQAVMDAGVTCISEEHIQTGDGDRILNTYKSPLFDLDGTVMGTVGVALDVTQERAYEQELLKKNHTLEWLFTTMECGVLCHTVDGSRIINVNRAALQILGYESQEELESEGFDSVAASVLEEDKPKLRQCIHSLHRVNESASTEYRVRHKDGKLLHVMGNIKLVEEDGEWFYQRFLLDCTAQKLRDQAAQDQMGQQIKYQEQRFNVFSSYLAANSGDVYLMLNAAADQVEYISPNVDRVLGIPADLVGANLHQLGKAKYVDGEAITLDDLLQMSPGDSLEARETERINCATNEHQWFQESVYCVSLQGEKKLIVCISDRTKERKTQDSLNEALQMAQVANKAKSAFLSSVSHDIRTPMNAIMGFIALLREEAGDKARVLEYVQRIDAASQHLLGLINDVLDLNKIESGSATLHLVDLNLADVIGEINAIIRPQAKARDQSFDIFVSPLTHERLIGDQLRINQILINILSNAVKYTQNGGTISLTVTELPQVVDCYSRIQFMIKDNGRGMSEAYQKVIFTPFTREQDTTINQVQGTGLGMSITKNLVDMMGGTISVSSQLDKGSTFTVELELRIQEQQGDQKFWSNYGISRIIVIDDDQDVCASVQHAMADTGVQVEFATDGVTAFEMICHAWGDKHPYDLILLDWKMPGLNGLETARMIHKNYPSKIPILFFTSYDWGDIEQEATEVGVAYFMPKPFFLSNFKAAVCKIMDPKDKKGAGQANNAVTGKHILVVDDIEVNRLILAKILGTLGAVCDTAVNGQEAVEKFTASAPGTYDVIMMDIQMPVMDGHTATRAIRASAHPSAKDVAIIAMTANAFVDDVREALAAGMDAHIAKPLVVDKMLATIHDVLTAKQQ